MRSIRPLVAARPVEDAHRRPSRLLAAVGLATALALTATACGPDGGGADAAASATQDAPGEDGGIRIPDHIKDKLEEHGIDIDKWRDGAWRNWDRDDWLREAEDFVNPIIRDLWNPDRMREAEEPEKAVDDGDLTGDRGVTDPAPAPVRAEAVPTEYHESVPEAGKVFFDSPEGQTVCSATVVEDPAAPGRSNLVWTAGHCVHAGRSGGWYRNIAFVPSYNDSGMTAAELETATKEEIAPYGVWWGDWAQTSDQWIEQGRRTGGDGAPYDFAVIHVTPEAGGDGRSLEETVGAALPVDFDGPAAPEVESVTATGYPASAPYDGQTLYRCTDAPGRLSLVTSDPTMYRIGCTMTGGASGGGWVATGSDGRPVLVSNTSIGPVEAGWLAGPRLGTEAEGVYKAVSEKFAGQ
ncbi:trypsin-like serine peptidase [Streptomyces poonensis]|nr:hypothetical protein [Streptomyces poonensis]